jgi:monoamine oxidase
VPRTNQLDASLEVADLSGRLVFAGAGFAPGSYALINGAVDTGISAAHKVLRSLVTPVG